MHSTRLALCLGVMVAVASAAHPQTTPEDQARAFLERLQKADDAEAEQGLVALGPDAVPVLMESCTSAPGPVLWRYARVFRGLRDGGRANASALKKVAPDLLDLALDPKAKDPPRVGAAFCWGSLGEAATAKTLKRFTESLEQSADIQLPEVALIAAAGHLGPAVAKEKKLQKLLDHKSYRPAALAMGTLAALGPEAEPARRKLVAVVEDTRSWRGYFLWPSAAFVLQDISSARRAFEKASERRQREEAGVIKGGLMVPAASRSARSLNAFLQQQGGFTLEREFEFDEPLADSNGDGRRSGGELIHGLLLQFCRASRKLSQHSGSFEELLELAAKTAVDGRSAVLLHDRIGNRYAVK